jgi:hypothetical protein
MSRRPRKPTKESSVAFGVVEGAGLIWIDASPLLKAEQTKLRSVRNKLSASEERVRLHKQSDEPTYQLWFSARFAERLGEIRSLYAKLAELDAIVWKVEREILATGCSAVEAYGTVLRMIAEEAEASKAEADGSSSNSEQDSNEREDSCDHDEDRGDNSSDDFDESWQATSKKPASKKEKAADDLLKQIYRSLVRKLHPDLNPDLPDALRERWFEVQQAYGDRDLARLEMLLSACEDGDESADDSFIDKIQSLTRLRLLLKSVAKKLKTSQRQLAQFKNAPAWEFHKTRKDPRRMAGLERDVKFELRNAEETLSGDIRTLEAQIERWTNPVQGRGRSRRRNNRDWSLSFD